MNKIPLEVLSSDLSMYEKSMLIILRQFCVGTPVDLFYHNTKQIAKDLGVTYKTVYTQVQLLIRKGYVEEKMCSFTKKVNGYRLTARVDWYYSFDLGLYQSENTNDCRLIIT